MSHSVWYRTILLHSLLRVLKKISRYFIILYRYIKRYLGRYGIQIGSGFNQVSGSGSGLGIRIQEGKTVPQK
jgi:hypothetical protein